MKRFFIVFLSLLSFMSLSAQQAKRVYITLDVSKSMTGNKYVLANYTTQMIVTLCNEDDEVSMIVYGIEERLSPKRTPLGIIQKPMTQLQFGSPEKKNSEFQDIIGFNNIYKPSENKQNWLFIIGDGDWSTQSAQYKNDRDKFRKTVEEGTLNVCFLQTEGTLNKTNNFTLFVDSLGIVDIRKSDINIPTIKEGCDYFARKILGFSEATLNIKKSGQKCIVIKAEVPLKEFYLVYQDQAVPTALPQINEVTADGNTLHITLKGTPTTVPLKSQAKEVTLSGHVYHIWGERPILSNKEIEVCFDKEINPANIRIYPIMEDVEFGSLSLTRAGGKLKQLDSHTFSICQEESKAVVRIELNEKASENLPEVLLKKTKVVVKANNKDYKAEYKDGGFECVIDLLENETQYYAECDCPGYFKRVTPITKIVKTDDCPPEEKVDMDVREMPTSDLGTISFESLKNDNISFTIHDSLTNQVLNPELFDISFEIANDYLYEEPVMHIENDSIIVLQVRPKGDWCECLFPESLDIKMISTPKKSAYDEYGKKYNQTVLPIHLTVVKDRSWLSRCLWVILTIIGLLLFLFYLWALQRKHRFKKNAMITPSYLDYYGNMREAGSINLRKEGFGAWFARWFLPNDERNTLSFDKPTTSIHFVAAESYDIVNIPKEGNIDPETMGISGYNPTRDKNPKEPVKLRNQGKITIYNSDGSDEGYLTFLSGDAIDCAFYRIIISLLMTASVIVIIGLIYLLVKSFF